MNKVDYEKIIDEKLAIAKEEMIEELMQKIEEEQKEEFQYGDKYYYVSANGNIEHVTWIGDKIDEGVLEIGNRFKTAEEAEFERERRIVIKELKKYAEPEDRKWDGGNAHWYIGYDYPKHEMDYGSVYRTKYGDIYFESEEKAKEAVKAVGTYRVKKYYLRVED